MKCSSFGCRYPPTRRRGTICGRCYNTERREKDADRKAQRFDFTPAQIEARYQRAVAQRRYDAWMARQEAA